MFGRSCLCCGLFLRISFLRLEINLFKLFFFKCRNYCYSFTLCCSHLLLEMVVDIGVLLVLLFVNIASPSFGKVPTVSTGRAIFITF